MAYGQHLKLSKMVIDLNAAEPAMQRSDENALFGKSAKFQNR